MAGLITHMVIAKEMLKLLPAKTITDEGLFYLGTLAPDAIHSREGYVRAYKKHTHFRDDILDKDFTLEENLILFHDRVAEFILANRERDDGLLDLYRGYVVHLLTDELFILTIRNEFCTTMEKQGITQSDRLFFDTIVTDMNRNDLLLVKNYEGIDEIREKMEQARIYPINGYIYEQEISDSRDWLIHRHFMEKHDILEPAYISYEQTLEFIRMAAVDLVDRLSVGGSLPRMF
jgi:hypothetical protein